VDRNVDTAKNRVQSVCTDRVACRANLRQCGSRARGQGHNAYRTTHIDTLVHLCNLCLLSRRPLELHFPPTTLLLEKRLLKLAGEPLLEEVATMVCKRIGSTLIWVIWVIPIIIPLSQLYSV
jgi:hypothetical protein